MKEYIKNKKGFTLIEIIVVLVILAILAAATIPSMLGFVEDARGKALIAEARTCLLAAQSIATEEGLKGTPNSSIKTGLDGASGSSPGAIATRLIDMLAPDILLGTPSVTVARAVFTMDSSTAGLVNRIDYTKRVGSKEFTVTIDKSTNTTTLTK